jgi:hypothetical protein
MTIPERPSISIAQMAEACEVAADSPLAYMLIGSDRLRAAASVLRQVERGELVPADQANARAEANTKDAARYRYLRWDLGSGRESHMWEVKWWSGKQWLWCSGPLLDDRIDAARAAPEPTRESG